MKYIFLAYVLISNSSVISDNTRRPQQSREPSAKKTEMQRSSSL